MKTLMTLLLLLSMNALAEKPNILWIIAEDISPDLGAFGNTSVHTPNLDKLAAKGMSFSRVFTTAPACSPSRTALATGVFQTTLGAHHMRYPESLKPQLKQPYKTITQLMRQLGYLTGNIRKLDVNATGKDDWQFKAEKKWDSSDWQQLTTADKPFFAQINVSEAHRTFRRRSKVKVDAAKIKLPPYYPDHSVTRRDWSGYLEDVNYLDEKIALILQRLKKEKLDKNTIIFFFSDHGRPMIRGKNWLYDSGTHIPLIVNIPEKFAPPAYHPGQRSQALLSSIDIVAETLLLAGGAVPNWMQGRSFLRRDSQKRQQVFSAMDRFGGVDNCSRSVRTARYKYIRNYKTKASVNSAATAYRRSTHPIHHLLNILKTKGQLNSSAAALVKERPTEELYDLQNDPYEINNLAAVPESQTVRRHLEASLNKWIHDSEDQGFKKDPQALADAFRAYGEKTDKQRSPAIEKLYKNVLKEAL